MVFFANSRRPPQKCHRISKGTACFFDAALPRWRVCRDVARNRHATATRFRPHGRPIAYAAMHQSIEMVLKRAVVSQGMGSA